VKTAPNFLTLQLKRFDYDYSTWQRIKLNNRFDILIFLIFFFLFVGFIFLLTNSRVTFPTTLDFSRWLVPLDSGTEIQNSIDNKYDLVSVLIHSGGAMGGHYYAIIKNIETSKWYKFNDASGTLLPPFYS
jgi:ubiquitin C-terminal hydrolase